MESTENQHREPLLWQKELQRLATTWKRISIVRRILVSGLLLAIIGSIAYHFVRLSRAPFIWSAIAFALAWVGLEVLWKCFFACYVGMAQAEWMKSRAKWVKARSAADDACGQIVSLREVLQRSLADKTAALTASLQEVNSLSGDIHSLSGNIQVLLSDVDQLFRKLDDEVSPRVFSAIGRSTLRKVTSKWQKFGLILPNKIRREAFEPAFNEMLQRCIPAWKVVGEGGRGWLVLGFTIFCIYIVLDCVRVMLMSLGGAVLLGLVPRSLRAWGRRQ